MTEIFIDGFDKYGPSNVASYGAGTVSLLGAEYAAAGPAGNNSSNYTAIGPGLSSAGYSLAMLSTNTNPYNFVTKTFTGQSRLVGGVRLSFGTGANALILFQTNGANPLTNSNQCTITVNTAGTGLVQMRTGNQNGTVLGTSAAGMAANSVHYLEWDITFGSSGAYTIYLDGVAILTGTGNTASSGGSTANSMSLGLNQNSGSGTTSVNWDDLYLFNTAGAVNNAVLLTSPRVATIFPTADSAVQFSPSATVLGSDYSTTVSTSAPGANKLFLRQFIPAVAMTLNSVSCVPEATSAGANFKAVLYSDSAGSPGSLVATGTQTTGATSGAALSSAFASGQSLAAGTPYWIGFITDTSVALALVDSTTTGQAASNTYSSGAPSTAPAMSAGQSSWQLWGNCTGAAHNYPSLSQNPPLGSASYVQSSTVGAEDLYGFGSLPSVPAAIYTVAVKAYVQKGDAGARTVNVAIQSGAAGATGAAAAPGQSFTWVDGYFDTDPNTGAAWTQSGLAAATAGFSVAS